MMRESAMIIGSNGTIGQALKDELGEHYDLHCISRDNTDYSENSLSSLATRIEQGMPLKLIICCVGVLHNENVSPEKNLKGLNEESLADYFRVNTIIPALCIKHFGSLLDKSKPSSFAFLSAMVGSIGDNKLGGWYGYRSSKAALNQMVKTASIEIRRSNRNASIVTIHPGTTRGPLSKPFSSRVPSNKYYSPAESASRIVKVVRGLTPEQSGRFFNWDGSEIPW